MENTYKVVEFGQFKIALQSQEQRLSDLQKSPCQCKLSENTHNSWIYTHTAWVPEARCLCEAVCRIYWVKNNSCRAEDAGLCLQTGPETKFSET